MDRDILAGMAGGPDSPLYNGQDTLTDEILLFKSPFPGPPDCICQVQVRCS